MKKFQYNISHKVGEEIEVIGFHSKGNMIHYLNKNKNYLNKLPVEANKNLLHRTVGKRASSKKYF